LKQAYQSFAQLKFHPTRVIYPDAVRFELANG
jgi:hypothetical protein